jgi:hypothetical protein
MRNFSYLQKAGLSNQPPEWQKFAESGHTVTENLSGRDGSRWLTANPGSDRPSELITLIRHFLKKIASASFSIFILRTKFLDFI